ncbi:hypothetical protein CK203_115210 [Vitis vinifera]|uniref:Uncharacterized protein n=1 Tax=Vitis vinifera TaxID=29760 RepID=A0A438FDQ3_VITVI|nr:hypothetical protein CK203_115210 [Vitis vinifera]
MVVRRLQPKIARHLIRVPFIDFGSLVMALFSVEEGFVRGLWSDSFPIDSKGKEPSGEQRPDVNTISPTRYRTFRRH